MRIISLFSHLLWWAAITNVNASAIPRRSPGVVVKAGEPVVIDPNGVYIRGSLTSDGGLIAGYTAHENNQAILRLVRSTNGGSSWQFVSEVYRGDVGTHDIDNPMVLQIPSGRILYAYRNHDRSDGAYTYYRISISYSDDGGKTFNYLSQVEQRSPIPNTPSGLWEPFLRLAADGSLQCYYSSENSSSDQDGFMKHSSDGGKTWSSPIRVSGGDRVSRDGMIGVATTGSSKDLIAVFENTETGSFTVDYVLSHDDGYTWGQRGRLYTPRNGGMAGAPQVYNVGGTLVASFMTNEDVPGLNDLDGGQMKVITSTDGGNTWSGSVVTGETGSHWPGLLTRDATHFLALYSRSGLGAVSQLYQLQ
ncbi:glycoside hydrolase family 93 protein [Xylariaceae sp. FL1272]|nr:glycoside hydrolase family 93 protein [Xylariaceae sp. FL1272]